MKKIVLVVLVAMFSYGKVLQYNTAFENLSAGDTVDVDLHLHYPLDSIKNVVNGNLTGSNISDTARFNQRVIDSVKYTNADWMFNYTRRWQKWNPGTFNGRFGRGVYFYLNDTTAYDEDFRLYFDSTKLKFLVNDDSTWTSKLIADTVKATYGDFTLFDTVRATYGDFALQDSLKSNVIKGDSLTYIGNDTTRFVVTKAGNVGIGTATPAKKLTVEGGGTTSFQLSSTAANTSTIAIETVSGQNRVDFTCNATRFLVGNYLGRVGIDTITPGSKLHVAGSARVRDTTYTTYLKSNTLLADSLTYIGNDTTRFKITKAGNVGIGTVTPGSKLHLSFSDNNGIRIQRTATAVSSWDIRPGDIAAGDLDFLDNIAGLSRMIITGTGNVGIDTITPGSKLHVAGSIRARDTVFALVYVDLTPGYKEGALKDLRKIRNDRKGNIDHGTLPEYARAKWKVDTGNRLINKTKTVEGRDIGAMVSILTKAVQELADKVDSLELELNQRGTQ